jgi:hypothetical protein
MISYRNSASPYTVYTKHRLFEYFSLQNTRGTMCNCDQFFVGDSITIFWHVASEYMRVS